MWLLLCVTLLLCLIGCSKEDLLQRFSTPEDQATAKSYIDRLRTHDIDGIENLIDPSVKEPALHAELEKMANLIPPGEPTSVKLVGAQSTRTPGASIVNSVFEYNFAGKWLLASVAVKESSGHKTIVGMNVNTRTQSLEEENRFTLSGKSTLQYSVLGAALVAILVTFYSLVICIRTRVPRKKWLWILFILIGFGNLGVDWTTGQWGFHLLAFQVFSASATAAFYGPWTISVSLPVGAVVFLIYRRKLAAETQPPAAPAGESERVSDVTDTGHDHA